ncbi:MAG: thiamine-phosphate kinase [Candidatus Ancaeobacter aquaticus]|nr:thiamine-phosphate kinase [Candidatus Ancaeobacter aquaticus]
MKVSEIGEFGLIDKFKNKLKKNKDVIVGIGDDAAVLTSANKNVYTLFASDMFVEGIHFRKSDASPYMIGRKAIAANISDIAAMGGVPQYAVVSLGVSPQENVQYCEEIYRGMNSWLDVFKINIVGGDTVSSPKGMVISIAILGEVDKRKCIVRSGACPWDVILATGTLGGSYAKKQYSFTPRVREAYYLANNFSVTSMIDISDGLLSDCQRITEASNLGALIFTDYIPLSSAVKKNCPRKVSIEKALTDGEDFELLFSVSQNEVKTLIKKWKRSFKTPVSVIGVMTPEKGVRLVNKDGSVTIPENKGYDHFKTKNKK